jgi:replication factor A1
MLKIPLENIVSKIKENTKLTEADINKKIENKVKELSGLVSKEGAAHIIANELGVKLFQQTVSGRLQIKNIVPGLRNVSFLARVVTIYPVRDFKTEKKEGKVASLVVSDETGRMRVVFWDTNHIKLIEEGKLKEGDLIRLKNGYVRESRVSDMLEVHTSGTSTIEINPQDPDADKIPAVKIVRETANRMKIANIEEGIQEIRGAIVNIFEGNLFYDVCPECGKRARDNLCQEHGEVIPKQSLMLSTMVDDGSGNMRVIFFGSRAQRILGMSAEEAFKLAKEHNDPLYPLNKQMNDILGREIVVDGKVSKNSFSGDLEMIARNISNPNPSNEAKMLLK